MNSTPRKRCRVWCADRHSLKTGCIGALALFTLGTLSGCAVNVVSLEEWWTGVVDRTSSTPDAIGGYLLLYWVDREGNACHGEPGVSGQPGPRALYVYYKRALLAANRGEAISPEQMTDFQVIPYYIKEYRESGASGLHYYQFDNFLWRSRRNGVGVSAPYNRAYSIPMILSLDSPPPGRLSPVAAFGHDSCFSKQQLIVPDPRPPAERQVQHPFKCRQRIEPRSATQDLEQRLARCLLLLPHGLDYGW